MLVSMYSIVIEYFPSHLLCMFCEAALWFPGGAKEDEYVRG